MRICFFANANYSLFHRRAESIAQRGHEVIVLSLQEGEFANCIVHQLSPGNIILQRMKGQYIGALPDACRLLSELAPDIVDLHGVSSYGIYSLLPKQAPLVATVYGPDVYDQAKRFWPLRLVAKAAVSRADMVFGSTPAIGNYVQDILGLDVHERLRTRSWGIPVSDILANAEQRRANIRNELGVSDNTRVILHSRQLARIWRIPLIIEAAPAILSAYPDTEFWFAYPPPNITGRSLLSQYQLRVEELGIQENIRWLGYHPYERMISIMHAADVNIGVGLEDLLASTLLEAMATGMVVVLANIPAYREVICDGINGFLLPEVTSESLSIQVNAVLADFKTIQPRMAIYNRQLVTDYYDEEVTTRWILDHYQQLADKFRNGRH